MSRRRSIWRAVKRAVNLELGLSEHHLPQFVTNTTSVGPDWIQLAWPGVTVDIKIDQSVIDKLADLVEEET